MNLLNKIINQKKEEIARAQSRVSLQDLKRKTDTSVQCFSLAKNLKSKTGIIAEFKRKSPSKGVINNQANLVNVGKAYDKWGASGISVLTDSFFFGGSKQDFKTLRAEVNCPMLRKDFMISEYQFWEAKAMGADAVLLIAACLSKNQVQEFSELSKELGLEVLLEVHTEKECDFYNENIQMIGINNRNLKDFKVDWQHSLRLKAALPKTVLSVAESGISNLQEFQFLKENGFDGFLMGEIFMKEALPELAFEAFSKNL